MPENKRSQAKIVLPALVLAASFHYSFSFTFAIAIGYLFARLFCHLFVHNGKINSIFIDMGKWQLHLHHWIMGVILLAIVWVIDYFYLPTFFAGFVCGVIIQDIYDYNDWHKVITKKEEQTLA